MLAVDLDMVIVAGEPIHQRDTVNEHVTALMLLHIDGRHAACERCTLFHIVVIHRGALHGHNLNDLVVQVAVVGALGMITRE